MENHAVGVETEFHDDEGRIQVVKGEMQAVRRCYS